MVQSLWCIRQCCVDVLRFLSDVTHILPQIESGNPYAAGQLLQGLYNELRKLAAVRMAQATHVTDAVDEDPFVGWADVGVEHGVFKGLSVALKNTVQSCLRPVSRFWFRCRESRESAFRTDRRCSRLH